MIEGEYQDVLKVFSIHLNFSIRQFKRFDSVWGTYDEENGLWNGMISNLVNGEADMITASLTSCCGRIEVLDHLWTLSQATLGFMIKSN